LNANLAQAFGTFNQQLSPGLENAARFGVSVNFERPFKAMHAHDPADLDHVIRTVTHTVFQIIR
jgi:hypothetical protein